MQCIYVAEYNLRLPKRSFKILSCSDLSKKKNVNTNTMFLFSLFVWGICDILMVMTMETLLIYAKKTEKKELDWKFHLITIFNAFCQMICQKNNNSNYTQRKKYETKLWPWFMCLHWMCFTENCMRFFSDICGYLINSMEFSLCVYTKPISFRLKFISFFILLLWFQTLAIILYLFSLCRFYYHFVYCRIEELISKHNWFIFEKKTSTVSSVRLFSLFVNLYFKSIPSKYFISLTIIPLQKRMIAFNLPQLRLFEHLYYIYID